MFVTLLFRLASCLLALKGCVKVDIADHEARLYLIIGIRVDIQDLVSCVWSNCQFRKVKGAGAFNTNNNEFLFNSEANVDHICGRTYDWKLCWGCYTCTDARNTYVVSRHHSVYSGSASNAGTWTDTDGGQLTVSIYRSRTVCEDKTLITQASYRAHVLCANKAFQILAGAC